MFRAAGGLQLHVLEVVNLEALDITQRQRQLLAEESLELEHRLGRLLRALPFVLGSEEYARGGSTETPRVMADALHQFRWEIPRDNYSKIKPIVDLLHDLDGWPKHVR